MPIRLPKIVPNSGWTAESSDLPAEIWSKDRVVSQYGEVTVNPIGQPSNNQTFIVNGTTYTFKSATTNVARDVKIDGGGAAFTLANLQEQIQLNDSSLFSSWIDFSGLLHIRSMSAGDGNDIAITGTYTGFTVDSTNANGNNGALVFDGEIVEVVVNESFTYTVTLGPYAESDGPSAVASEINTAVGANAMSAANADGRISITTLADGPSATIRVTTNTTTLFNVNQFTLGRSIAHPTSDNAGTTQIIRMFHPADPVFFRNDNRPIIDLADNDKQIWTELIALRDGYDYFDGTELTSADDRLKLKAKAGYTFESNVTFNGDVTLSGGNVFQQNVTVLNVADKTITVNAGETGSGVSGTGKAGLIVDRGTAGDKFLMWEESSAGWVLNDDLLIGGSDTPFIRLEGSVRQILGSLAISATALEITKNTSGDIRLNVADTYAIKFQTSSTDGINLEINVAGDEYAFYPVEGGTEVANHRLSWDRTDDKWKIENGITITDTGATNEADIEIVSGDLVIDRLSSGNIRLNTFATTNRVQSRVANADGVDLKIITGGAGSYRFIPVESSLDVSGNDFYWDIATQSWTFDGPVVFSGPVTGGFNIITIGDGTNTFGTYDAVAGNIDTALANAIGDLTSGGMIFIYRGTYTLTTATTLTDGVHLTGEGAGTIIEMPASNLTTSNNDRVQVSNIRLSATGSTTLTLLSLGATAQFCNINNVWFTDDGTGTTTDITYTLSQGNIIYGCASTTDTTNLP